MDFLEAVRFAINGDPIRRVSWIADVLLRWNIDRLHWEMAIKSDGEYKWSNSDGPSPLWILAKDWEVVLL